MCLLHPVTGNYDCWMYKDINPFGVRFPAELRKKVEESAALNHRSLNAEIVAQMFDVYRSKSALSDFSDGDLIDELIKRWGRAHVSIRLGSKDE
jgi:hypothetical protein